MNTGRAWQVTSDQARPLEKNMSTADFFTADNSQQPATTSGGGLPNWFTSILDAGTKIVSTPIAANLGFGNTKPVTSSGSASAFGVKKPTDWIPIVLIGGGALLLILVIIRFARKA